MLLKEKTSNQNRPAVLRRSVEEAVDGIGDFSRGVFDVLGGVLGEQDVGVLLVEAVVLRTDVLLVVPLQALTKFDVWKDYDFLRKSIDLCTLLAQCRQIAAT